MDNMEWIARCSARLHAQWPRLARTAPRRANAWANPPMPGCLPNRDEVARDLLSERRWQQCEPEAAVVEWLSQGIPVSAAGDASCR